MTLVEMHDAVNDARQTLRKVADVSNKMADMLVGNLRHANDSTAARLKKELADYNIHTGRWRNK